MRRIGVAASTLVVLVVVMAPPAGAQYVGAADISLSDVSGACPGGVITISGEGWTPIEPAVIIEFDGEEIAREFPDAQGQFSITITLPEADPGEHTIRAFQFVAPEEPDVIEATATFVCVGAAAPALAVTGGSVQVWMLLVAGLVVGGAALLLVGRRRGRRSAVS